jgi:hypothetical protein
MLANLAPSQEPALWAGVVTAILGVIVVFLPRFGVTLSKDEYTAVAALAVAVIPVVLALLVRSNVTPNASLPAKTP